MTATSLKELVAGGIAFFRWPSSLQRKETFTTNSFPVAQFDASQKPFVEFGNVAITVVQREQRCRTGLEVVNAYP